MNRRLSDTFFILGIVLLLIGLYLYAISIYWIFIYGIGAMLLGSLFILVSAKKSKTKLIIISIPFLIVGVLFYYSFTTPEIFLIPEGYKGHIYIIFNQANGVDKEFEGNRRVYRIPSTGVLFTKFKDEEGFIDQKYYYQKTNGTRIKLPLLDRRSFNEGYSKFKNLNEPSRDSLAIFDNGEMGGMSGQNKGEIYVYEKFNVGTYNDLNSFSDFKSDDILIHSLNKSNH